MIVNGKVYVYGNVEQHYEMQTVKKVVINQRVVATEEVQQVSLNFNAPVGNAIAHANVVEDIEEHEEL